MLSWRSTLQFGVEKAKVMWGAFIRNMGVGKATKNSSYDPTSSPGPSVVAHNENGEKRVIEVTQDRQGSSGSDRRH